MATALPQNMGSASTPGSDVLLQGLNWEGDKMFNIYIHDYCFKRGYRKTAKELMMEADIPPESSPPINARQGLLFEWWSVFWELFTAKANGTGPEEALIYVQHQNRLRQQTPHSAGPAVIGGQPTSQHTLPPSGMRNGVPPGGGRFMPNGAMINGTMPSGSAPHTQPPSFPPPGPPQPNGITAPSPGGQPPPFQQPVVPGQRPPTNGQPRPGPVGGPPNTLGGPFQPSPTMDPAQHNMGQQPNAQQHPGQMMGQRINNMMVPPNGQGMPHQAPTPNSGGFMGRPPSRVGTPGSGAHMMTSSPSLGARQRPQMAQLEQEFSKIPAQLMMGLKQELGFDGRDPQSLTFEDKQRLMMLFQSKGFRQRPGNIPPNAAPGPSMPPNRGPPPRVAGKRNSTSPPEDHDMGQTNGSSPPSKRMRRSPQEQPQGPMAGMPYPPQGMQPQMGGMPGGGPGPGPHQMTPMMRPMSGIPPNGGFQPGMPNMMSGMQGPNPNMGMTPQMQQQQHYARMQMGGGQGRPMNQGMLPNSIPHGNAASPAADGFNATGPGPGGPPFNVGPPGGGQRAGPLHMQPGPQQKNPMMGIGMMPPSSSPNTLGKDGGKEKEEGQHSASTPRPGTAPPTPVPGAAPQTPSQMHSSIPPGPQNPNIFPTLDPSMNMAMLGGTNDTFTSDFLSGITSGLEDFGQAGFLATSMEGDLSFDRDFGQWFSSEDPVTSGLDMK